MEHYNFYCPACKIDQHYPTNLNKHLEICKIYPEWIKTYKPPKTFDCKHCELKFVRQTNLDEHILIHFSKSGAKCGAKL